MSGFEVVGLALAIAPLVISCLEHYKDGLGTFQTWKKYDRHLEELIRQLAQQQTHFKQNLVLLLESADVESEKLDIFDEALWKGEIAEAIEEQLGIAFNDYHVVVKNYFSLLESIISRFKYLPGLDDTTTITVTQKYETILNRNPSQDGKFSFTQRLKFTMKHKEVISLIGKLNESNQTLERFQVKSDQLGRVDKEKSSRRYRKVFWNLRKVRAHANSLYNSFCRGFKPICHSSHDASLVLEPRLPERKKFNTISFKVLFVTAQAQRSEFSINILNDEEDVWKDWSYGSMGIEKIKTPQIIAPKARLQLDKVKNLCDTIHKASMEQKGLQFHLNSDHDLTYSHGGCVPPCFISSREELVTLDKLISSRRLQLRTRMKLALILSSGLLQLCNTPWLDTGCWSKKTIFFRSQATSTVCGSGCFVRDDDAHKPFITHEFSSHTANRCYPVSSDATWSLLELGILLLELFLNTTLEEAYREEAQLAERDPYKRHTLALKWLDHSKNEIYPDAYWLAAKSCIKCHFGDVSQTPSWDDETFQQAVCKGVIATLSEGLQYIM